MHHRHLITPRSIRLTRAKFPIKLPLADIITSTARTRGVMARNRIIFIRTCLFQILGSLPL